MAEGAPGANIPTESRSQYSMAPDVSLDTIRELSGNNGLVSFVFQKTLAQLDGVDTVIIDDPHLNLSLQQRIENRKREREQREREIQAQEDLRAEEERVMAAMREPVPIVMRPEDLQEEELRSVPYEEPDGEETVFDTVTPEQGATPLPQSRLDRWKQVTKQRAQELGQKGKAKLQKANEKYNPYYNDNIQRVELAPFIPIVQQLSELAGKNAEFAVELSEDEATELLKELAPEAVKRLWGEQLAYANSGFMSRVVSTSAGPYINAEVRAGIIPAAQEQDEGEKTFLNGEINARGVLYGKGEQIKIKPYKDEQMLRIFMPRTALADNPAAENFLSSQDFDLQTLLRDELNLQPNFVDTNTQIKNIKMRLRKKGIVLIVQGDPKTAVPTATPASEPVVTDLDRFRPPAQPVTPEVRRVEPSALPELKLNDDSDIMIQLSAEAKHRPEFAFVLDNDQAVQLMEEIVPGLVVAAGDGEIERADLSGSTHIDSHNKNASVKGIVLTMYKNQEESSRVKSGFIDFKAELVEDHGHIRVESGGPFGSVNVLMEGLGADINEDAINAYLQAPDFDLKQELARRLSMHPRFRDMGFNVRNLDMKLEEGAIRIDIRGATIPPQTILRPAAVEKQSAPAAVISRAELQPVRDVRKTPEIAQTTELIIERGTPVIDQIANFARENPRFTVNLDENWAFDLAAWLTPGVVRELIGRPITDAFIGFESTIEMHENTANSHIIVRCKEPDNTNSAVTFQGQLYQDADIIHVRRLDSKPMVLMQVGDKSVDNATAEQDLTDPSFDLQDTLKELLNQQEQFQDVEIEDLVITFKEGIIHLEVQSKKKDNKLQTPPIARQLEQPEPIVSPKPASAETLQTTPTENPTPLAELQINPNQPIFEQIRRATETNDGIELHLDETGVRAFITEMTGPLVNRFGKGIIGNAELGKNFRIQLNNGNVNLEGDIKLKKGFLTLGTVGVDGVFGRLAGELRPISTPTQEIITLPTILGKLVPVDINEYLRNPSTNLEDDIVAALNKEGVLGNFNAESIILFFEKGALQVQIRGEKKKK